MLLAGCVTAEFMAVERHDDDDGWCAVGAAEVDLNVGRLPELRRLTQVPDSDSEMIASELELPAGASEGLGFALRCAENGPDALLPVEASL
eukprot:35579-Rhodomonas_salina.1